MADSVQGGYHNVRGANLMGLHLYLRHFVVPLGPLSLDRHLNDIGMKVSNTAAPHKLNTTSLINALYTL